MRRLILALALLFPAVALADINISNGSNYIAVRGVVWGNPFNVTYILTPINPNVGVCYYVQNNNPTNAHTFTVQVFQTANGGALDFTNNQGSFNSVLVNGSLSPVTASTTTAGFSGTTAAAQIAFKFSASSSLGGVPDTADLFFVQTGSNSCGAALSVLPVQGAVAENTSLTNINPLAIGGKAVSGPAGSSGFYSVSKPADPGGTNYNGFPIGGFSQVAAGIGSNSGVFTLPMGSPQGPLAIIPMGQRVTVGSLTTQFVSEGTGSGGTNGNPANMFVTNGGYAKIITSPLAFTVSGQNIPLWAGISGGQGVMTSCYFDITVANTAGTTPTFDVFVQTSNDGARWTDRIHFTQFTTGTVSQYAGISQGVGILPTTVQDRTLAVNTKVDGPVGWFGRFVFTVGGTASPSYNFTYGVSCS